MAVRFLKGLAVPVGLAILFGVICVAIHSSLLDDYRAVAEVPPSWAFVFGGFFGFLFGAPSMVRIWRAR